MAHTNSLSSSAVKPVSKWIVQPLSLLFVIGMLLFACGSLFIGWVEHDIIRELNITQAGLSKYTMRLPGEAPINLNKQEFEEITAFNGLDSLPEHQQELLYDGYNAVFERQPGSACLELYTKTALEITFLALFFGLPLLSLFGLFLVLMVQLYRGWKVLQPLRSINFAGSIGMPTPGQAIGYIFVPVLNLFWFFKAIGGLPKRGKLLAKNTGLDYTGPSTGLCISLALLLCWDIISGQTNFFPMSLWFWLDISSILAEAVIFPMMILKLGQMINNFSMVGQAIELMKTRKPDHTGPDSSGS